MGCVYDKVSYFNNIFCYYENCLFMNNLFFFKDKWVDYFFLNKNLILFLKKIYKLNYKNIIDWEISNFYGNINICDG